MTELVRVVSLVVLLAIPVLLAYRSFLVYKNQLALIRDLDVARIQGRQWRDETRALLKGLGEAIDRQFLTWKLTEAERDVGLFDPEGSEPERNRRSAGHQRTNDPRTGTIALREGRPERPCRPLGVLPGGPARTNRARQLLANRVADRQAKPPGAAARARLSKRDSSPLGTPPPLRRPALRTVGCVSATGGVYGPATRAEA